jgi:nitrogen regulatory protein PII
MKLIITIINPDKLEDVRVALTRIGIFDMNAIEVKSFGRQTGHLEVYRGAEFTVNFQPKVRIEIPVGFEQIDDVVQTIAIAAKIGPIDGGTIFVTPIEQAVRVYPEFAAVT